MSAAAPRRVVVAEDESLIRMDIVEILRDNGFDVVGEAGDGETVPSMRLTDRDRHILEAVHAYDGILADTQIKALFFTGVAFQSVDGEL